MNIFKRILIKSCPNCYSGEQMAKDTSHCIICSDPKTGNSRGWVWRWSWLHRKLVSDRNFVMVTKQGGKDTN
jgi:hypothetical protein